MKRSTQRQIVGANLGFVASAITNFMHHMNPASMVFKCLTDTERKYLLDTYRLQGRVFARLHKLSRRMQDDG